MNFEVVDPAQAETVRGKRRKNDNGWVAVVREGHMVHLTDVPMSRVSGYYTNFKAAGKRMRTRQDGNGGIYVWAEDA